MTAIKRFIAYTIIISAVFWLGGCGRTQKTTLDEERPISSVVSGTGPEAWVTVSAAGCVAAAAGGWLCPLPEEAGPQPAASKKAASNSRAFQLSTL